MTESTPQGREKGAGERARELIARVKSKHLCKTCHHGRGEHALDLEGQNFCEYEDAGRFCRCENYVGTRNPTWAELFAALESLAALDHEQT